MNQIEKALPLVIEFISGTKIVREQVVASTLPVFRNGPPATHIVFPNGSKIPLPTDQIVSFEDGVGYAIVGFGGMAFDGLKDARLLFRRVQEVRREEDLSPERSNFMTLEPAMVTLIYARGKFVWCDGLVH